MPYIGTQPKDVRSFGKVQFDFTATQGQTAFTGADDDGKTLGFTEGQIQVYVNGVLMDASDYTASGSNTITLTSAANANDIITVLALQTDIPNSDYVPSTGGNFSGEVNITSGSFGVGTFSPSRPVTVYHDTLPAIALHNSASNTGNGDGFQIQANSTDAYVWNYENTPINFGTNNTQRMSINSSGNVGIGTTSPSNVLHVHQSDATSNSYVHITQADGGSAATDGLSIGIEDGGVNAVIRNRENGYLRMFTNNTERMRIDSAGRVTMPYQPSFFVKEGSGFNTNGYLSSFGTVHHNIGGHFNNSTGQFTAPVAGRYLITAGILVETGTGRLEYKINHNGTSYASGNGTGTVYDGPTITAIVQMNANDYIRVDRISGTAYSNGNHGNTYFGGYLIG